MHCGTGVFADCRGAEEYGNPQVALRNCLLSQCDFAWSGGAYFTGEQLTLDQITGSYSDQLTATVNNDSYFRLTMWICDADADIEWDYSSGYPNPVVNGGQVYAGGTADGNSSVDLTWTASAGKRYSLWWYDQWYWYQGPLSQYSFSPVLDHFSLEISDPEGGEEGPAAESGTYLRPAPVNLTNCILANVADSGGFSGDFNGFYNTAGFGDTSFGSDDPPFVTSGNGSYYLKSDSPFRGVGTASADPALCDALKGKTTQPPMEIPTRTDHKRRTNAPAADPTLRGRAARPGLPL